VSRGLLTQGVPAIANRHGFERSCGFACCPHIRGPTSMACGCSPSRSFISVPGKHPHNGGSQNDGVSSEGYMQLLFSRMVVTSTTTWQKLSAWSIYLLGAYSSVGNISLRTCATFSTPDKKLAPLQVDNMNQTHDKKSRKSDCKLSHFNPQRDSQLTISYG
jgi:hypothetical protein